MAACTGEGPLLKMYSFQLSRLVNSAAAWPGTKVVRSRQRPCIAARSSGMPRDEDRRCSSATMSSTLCAASTRPFPAEPTPQSASSSAFSWSVAILPMAAEVAVSVATAVRTAIRRSRCPTAAEARVRRRRFRKPRPQAVAKAPAVQPALLAQGNRGWRATGPSPIPLGPMPRPEGQACGASTTGVHGAAPAAVAAIKAMTVVRDLRSNLGSATSG
mmetsp:Transcript_48849/g.123932  ORF Transcript_48849/g.123932 Transcript_48849/m.123932 type:complete len:216 (+) Transcript_48849:365-1012(+)